MANGGCQDYQSWRIKLYVKKHTPKKKNRTIAKVIIRTEEVVTFIREFRLKYTIRRKRKLTMSLLNDKNRFTEMLSVS